jgi:hypothetical protein
MGTNTTVEVASAATVWSLAATTALEVRERAVTLRDARGEVCPASGGTGFRPQTSTGFPTAPSGIARFGIAGASVMENDQVSKPRTGYHAISGTG